MATETIDGVQYYKKLSGASDQSLLKIDILCVEKDRHFVDSALLEKQFLIRLNPLDIGDFQRTLEQEDNTPSIGSDNGRRFWTQFVKMRDSYTKENGVFESSCDGECETAFRESWRFEYESMNFMIRYLSECCVYRKDTRNPPKLIIEEWHDKWKQCKFRLEFPEQKRRVVLGMGPSGCGKSTVALPIFKAYGLESVMAVDGGMARKVSFTWMLGVKLNTKGIKNLYSLMKSEFDVKTDMFKILNTAGTKKKFENASSNFCSIYMADTLSGVSNKTSKFVSLDADWIGVLIWQHKNCTDRSCENGIVRTCPYPKEFRCLGCDKAGSERAILEGKKFDSDAYFRSMNNGYAMMLRAPHRIMIHNFGREGGKSIYVTDDTVPQTEPNYKVVKMSFPDSGSGVGATDIKTGFGMFGRGLQACLDNIQRLIQGSCKRIWSKTFRALKGGNKTRRWY